MNKTNDFKFNLPAYSDPVDVEDLNDNFRVIDDALMAGLCKKDYTGNNMGSSDPSARKYAWAPWLEIVNDNEFDVVVTDRNAPVESEEATINIAAGQTFRKYINGRYYMNFYVQDQHDVTFKWFTNAETYINESGGGGGGTGTVTSVSVQGGSGSHLTASGNPIETSGTITINVDDGYSIPSDNEQTAWDGKAVDIALSIDSSTYVMTAQLKDSAGNLIGTAKTIDLPLETMVVDGEYDSQTQKIKLELKNGNYVEFSVADLVSGLQTELSASNKLDPDYIDYDSSHRAVSDTEKNTWNGKQNALTFDDTPTQNSNNPVKSGGVYSALAGKQASLDQTQLAAVNSGIDQTKVAQISTNQTNILYTLGRTGKNLYDIKHPTRAVNITLTDDGNGQFTQSASGAWAAWDYDFDVTVGVQYTVYIKFKSVTTYNAAGAVVLKDADGNDIKRDAVNSAQTLTYSFTAPTSRIRLGVTCNNSSYNQTGTFVMQDPMIVEKSIYDNFPDYQPYSGRQNSDLTHLEAEDRAELVELVDSGAKNVFQNSDGSDGANGTWDASTGTFTQTGTDGNANMDFRIKLYNGSTYVESLPTNYNTITANGRYGIEFTKTSAFNKFRCGHNGQSNDCNMWIDASKLKNGTTYVVSINVTNCKQSNGAYTFNDVMICTKAAFGVSKAFVPYRPNYDLVGSMASALNSPTLTVPAKHSYITSVKSGGYFRIGNIVIVNIVCTVGTALPLYQVLFTDLPTPVVSSSLAADDGVAVLSTNKDCVLSLTKAGQIINYESAIESGGLEISGVYICS